MYGSGGGILVYVSWQGWGKNFPRDDPAIKMKECMFTIIQKGINAILIQNR